MNTDSFLRGVGLAAALAVVIITGEQGAYAHTLPTLRSGAVMGPIAHKQSL